MYRLSPFLLAALLLALGLSACSKKDHAPVPLPPAPQPIHQPPPAPDRSPLTSFYNNEDSSPLFALLDSASRSLDIEIYEMGDPDVIAALRRALQRGVRLRVIKEPAPLGARCDVFGGQTPRMSPECADERALRAEILEKGGSYVAFAKEPLCADPSRPCFLHGKMVIADESAVLVSTGNFNSSNLCNRSRSPAKCNRDFSIVSRDPELAALFSQVFRSDLQGERYDLPALLTPGLREKATISPHSAGPIRQLIDSAKTSIRIQNQYLKDREMNAALLAAAARGVKVELTLSSLCAFGPPNEQAREQARQLFGEFDRARISTRMLPSEFRIGGRPGYLHSKAMLIDEQLAWVGSVNGSWSALSNNREFGLIFREAAPVEALKKVLLSDHNSPAMESWEESLDCKKDQLPDSPRPH